MSELLTRKQAAATLGLSYSMLRVYERSLALVLPSGPNRTRLYDQGAIEVVRKAVALHDLGIPMAHLRVAILNQGLERGLTFEDMEQFKAEMRAAYRRLDAALERLEGKLATWISREERRWAATSIGVSR